MWSTAKHTPRRRCGFAPQRIQRRGSPGQIRTAISNAICPHSIDVTLMATFSFEQELHRRFG
jgi:hypothetical protein